MANNFFDFLYGVNKRETKTDQTKTAEKSVQDESVAQDEAIGSPWTHKFTIYCSNPSKSFLEELKAKDGVVAVFMKEKETTPAPTEANPPDNK